MMMQSPSMSGRKGAISGMSMRKSGDKQMLIAKSDCDPHVLPTILTIHRPKREEIDQMRPRRVDKRPPAQKIPNTSSPFLSSLLHSEVTRDNC